MNSGEIIYSHGNYNIIFYKNTIGEFSEHGKIFTGKAYHLKLVKDGVDLKFYTTAVKYPSSQLPDFEKMKQEVIAGLKKFIL